MRKIILLALLICCGCSQRNYSPADYRKAADHLTALKIPMETFSAEYALCTNVQAVAQAIDHLNEGIITAEATHPLPSKDFFRGMRGKSNEEISPLFRDAFSNYWRSAEITAKTLNSLKEGDSWGADSIVKEALERLKKRQKR